MKNVELYGRVRYAVQIEGLSERAAARRFGIDPRTVSKMMKFSVPPGYVRKKPPARPKLDPFIPVIDRILGDDKSRPKKQQHTAKRIFERLRDVSADLLLPDDSQHLFFERMHLGISSFRFLKIAATWWAKSTAAPLRRALFNEGLDASAKVLAAVAGAHQIVAVRQAGLP
jgi:hypothetical protein